MKTVVVNIKNGEQCDVYIGRGSKWGNPFIVNHKPDESRSILDCRTRQEAIEKHKKWIMNQPNLLRDLHELKGKRLGCFCSPLPCHGDTLVWLVEQLDKE